MGNLPPGLAAYLANKKSGGQQAPQNQANQAPAAAPPKAAIKRKLQPQHKGMGFQAAQQGIAQKQGVPMSNAGAILASASRNASPAAKKKNPNLNNVPGG